MRFGHLPWNEYALQLGSERTEMPRGHSAYVDTVCEKERCRDGMGCLVVRSVKPNVCPSSYEYDLERSFVNTPSPAG